MANNESTRRQPQFTNTQYEIPSWQTPWSKPWYQKTDVHKDDTPPIYKYNERGHVNDCTCSNCEDDLEKAFSPNVDSTRQSVSDIPRDRHQDVNIQVHLEDLTITSGQESSTSAASCSPKKVFLLSDLEEVTPGTSSNSIATTRDATTAPNDRISREENSSISDHMTHDSAMDLFGSFSAIEAISQQTQDIQTRVYNYKGTSNTQDYKTMKELLEALMRELNRIHSNVEWFRISKNMALDAIKTTLVTLEQKAKQAEQS